jgi:hypothetical protein
MHAPIGCRLASIWRSLIFSGVAALITSPTFAGPPFRTDDPEPVEFQHFEINLLSLGTHTSGGWSVRLTSVPGHPA